MDTNPAYRASAAELEEDDDDDKLATVAAEDTAPATTLWIIEDAIAIVASSTAQSE